MPQITDPEKLFVHKLSTLYKGEKQIEKMLPKMAKEAEDRELTEKFLHHQEETQQQIKNIERIFDAVGQKPKTSPNPVVDGLKMEHDDFIEKQKPTPEILNSFLAGAAAATEHYEIAAYEGLITMANAKGEEDIVALLQENLEQEQHTLEEAKSAVERLARFQASITL